MDGYEGFLTYRAISRLGLIPVMGCKMMEPIEDILVGHARQAGWRVGPGDESSGRGGHGSFGVGESAETERDGGEVGSCYMARGASGTNLIVVYCGRIWKGRAGMLFA